MTYIHETKGRTLIPDSSVYLRLEYSKGCALRRVVVVCATTGREIELPVLSVEINSDAGAVLGRRVVDIARPAVRLEGEWHVEYVFDAEASEEKEADIVAPEGLPGAPRGLPETEGGHHGKGD